MTKPAALFLREALRRVDKRTSREVEARLRAVLRGSGAGWRDLLAAVALWRAGAGLPDDAEVSDEEANYLDRLARDSIRAGQYHALHPGHVGTLVDALRSLVRGVLSDLGGSDSAEVLSPFPPSAAEALDMLRERVTGDDPRGEKRLRQTLAVRPDADRGEESKTAPAVSEDSERARVTRRAVVRFVVDAGIIGSDEKEMKQRAVEQALSRASRGEFPGDPARANLFRELEAARNDEGFDLTRATTAVEVCRTLQTDSMAQESKLSESVKRDEARRRKSLA